MSESNEDIGCGLLILIGIGVAALFFLASIDINVKKLIPPTTKAAEAEKGP